MDIGKILSPFKVLLSDRVFVTALFSALGAVIVGLVPQFEPYRQQVIAALIGVVLLAAGGNIVQTVSDARVQVAQASGGAQTALIQGVTPLKPIAYTEFSDVEIRALAYKLGTMPPGDVSREELVYRIINAISVPTP